MEIYKNIVERYLLKLESEIKEIDIKLIEIKEKRSTLTSLYSDLVAISEDEEKKANK